MKRSDEMTERELYDHIYDAVKARYEDRDTPPIGMLWTEVSRKARKHDGQWKPAESFPQDLEVTACVAIGPLSAEGRDRITVALTEANYDWQKGVDGGRLDREAAMRLTDKLMDAIDEYLSDDVCECCGQEVAE